MKYIAISQMPLAVDLPHSKSTFCNTLIFLLAALLSLCGNSTQASSSALASSQSNWSSSSASSSVVYSQLRVRVNGLNIGGTLVLKINGGDPLTVTRNVHYFYKFSQPIAVGSSYSVTVDQQPTEQTCSVSPASGVMTASSSDMIFATCRNLETSSIQVATEGYPEQPLQVPLGALGIRNKAYPNILYESRIGTKGGVFPYEFRITGLTKNGLPVSSSGMTIDFRKGTLRWVPTEVGNYIVSVKIKDSRASGFVGNQEITQTFPIEVNPTKFSFVDISKGIDTATAGTISTPYKTIAYALANAPAANTIYVRKGVYPTGPVYLNGSSSVDLLAYPNQRVIWDQGFNGNINVNEDSRVARIEGFEFNNIRQYGFYVEAVGTGLVIRNNRFINGREVYNGEVADNGMGGNPGFIYTVSDKENPLPRHSNIMIQENYFGTFGLTNWLNENGEVRTSGGSAATFFDAKDIIVENNLSETDTENGFNDKETSRYSTFRENAILKASGQGFHLMGQHGAKGIDVHHNIVVGFGITVGTQGDHVEDIYIHHNTFTDGGLMWNSGLVGPASSNLNFHRNVISSSIEAPHKICEHQDLTAAFAKAHIDHNLYVTPPPLIMNNDWCPEYNDADKSKWQNLLGFDLHGIFTTSSPLTGSSTMRQLKSTSPYYKMYGHIY